MTKSGTEAEVKAWVQGTRPYDWYNQCAGLTMSICRHFGNGPALGAGGAYATATAAYNATKIVSKDSTKAPRGAIHYWSYTTEINGVRRNYGHVTVDIRGGGVATLSATSKASPEWGNNAGLISVATQTRAIGNNGRYLGWSLTYGKSYVANIVTEQKEEEVIEVVEREIALNKPQVLTQGKKAYLRLNDEPESHVTVAAGPRTIIGGSIQIVGKHSGEVRFVNGFPPVLQLEAIAEKVDAAGKVTGSPRVIGKLKEKMISAGNTYADYAMPAGILRSGERLRFRVVAFDVDKFTIGKSSINISFSVDAK